MSYWDFDRLAQALSLSRDLVKNRVMEDRFNDFKVPELKVILRFLKDSGAPVAQRNCECLFPPLLPLLVNYK